MTKPLTIEVLRTLASPDFGFSELCLSTLKHHRPVYPIHTPLLHLPQPQMIDSASIHSLRASQMIHPRRRKEQSGRALNNGRHARPSFANEDDAGIFGPLDARPELNTLASGSIK